MPLPPSLFSVDAIAPYAQQIAASDDQAAPSAPPPKKRGPSVIPAALATIAGNAADSYSTYRAIHDRGAREGNGLLPNNPLAIAGVKAAMTIPEVLIEKNLNDHGHSTMAKVLGLAIGGLGAGLGYYNSTVGKKK